MKVLNKTPGGAFLLLIPLLAVLALAGTLAPRAWADDLGGGTAADVLRDARKLKSDHRAGGGTAVVRHLPEERLDALQASIDFKLRVWGPPNQGIPGVIDPDRVVRRFFEKELRCAECTPVVYRGGASGSLKFTGDPQVPWSSYIQVKYGPGPSVHGLIAIDSRRLHQFLDKSIEIPLDQNKTYTIELTFSDRVHIWGFVQPDAKDLPAEASIVFAEEGAAQEVLHKERLNFMTRGRFDLTETYDGPSLKEMLEEVSFTVGPLELSTKGVKAHAGPVTISSEGVDLKLKYGSSSVKADAAYTLHLLQFKSPEKPKTPYGGVLVQLDYQTASIFDDKTSDKERHVQFNSGIGPKKEERTVDVSEAHRQRVDPQAGKTIAFETFKIGPAIFPGGDASHARPAFYSDYLQDGTFSKSAVLLNRVTLLRIQVNLELSKSQLPPDLAALLSFQSWPGPVPPKKD